MTPQEVKRKLAAILSADVKGYSRLMGEDEEGTIRTLNAYKAVLNGFIQRHQGRVFGNAGDGMLAEFASVVDAVRCAAGIQKELKDRNKQLAEEKRMEFRIGVNLGDVVEDGDTIYGDGVNIATRLESLSEAGGICISGTAFDQVRNKLELGYEYLGEQTVKNIALPVRVYKILLQPEAVGRIIGEKKAETMPWQRLVTLLVIILIVTAAAIAIWRLYLHPSPPPLEVASKEKMAFPLPDKPSIAVLPFTNMSGDPKEEYFSDGIAEEIITALSKTPHLFVISRQSTFTYKGKPVKVKQVSEELGVQYVLEGSVRKEAGKVRITAQLIDALTGHPLWAERYDRDLKDIFALQDEITMKIITAMQVKLTVGELANRWAEGTKNLEAYLKCMEAYTNYLRTTKEGNALAKKLAEEVIALDPKYPRGYVVLSQIYLWDILLGITEFPEKSLAKAKELAEKAISLDNSEANAHGILGSIYLMSRQHDKAMKQLEGAISLNPNNDATNLIRLAFVLVNSGRPQEAISVLKKHRRLNPVPFQQYYIQLVTAYRLSQQYKEAIETGNEALRQVPNNTNIYVQLIAAYIMTGEEEKARAAAVEVMKINPQFSLEWYVKTIYFKNQDDTDKTMDALRKAGLK